MLDINQLLLQIEHNTAQKPWIKRLMTHCMDGVMPRQCLMCDLPSDLPIAICRQCWPHLPWLDHACSQCACPLPLTERCGECRHHPPNFSQALALWHYKPPISHWINQFKHHGKLDLAHLFSHSLCAAISLHPDIKYSTLFPVPCHKKRQASRGFNQAKLLCQQAKDYHLAFDFSQPIIRHRHTAAQQNLSKKQRKQNCRNAFLWKHHPQGNAWCLIDDVITTGSTAQAIYNTPLPAPQKKAHKYIAALARVNY